jgi:hypothetical protein
VRQHYVPQGYLRRFKNENSNSKVAKVWVVDKHKDKPFSTPILDIASRVGFYDSEIDKYIKDHPERGLEKILGLMEQDFYRALDELDTCISNNVSLENTTKMAISRYLFLQYIRTSKFRSKLNNTENVDIPDNFKLDGFNKIAQIYGLGDVRLTQSFIDLCMGKTWIIYEMSGGLSIFTSDNPVVFAFDENSNVLNQAMSNLDPFDGSIQGMKIIFPLDPKHVLFLYDPHTRPDLISKDGQMLEFDTQESASLLNGLSSGCDRQIYAHQNSEMLEVAKMLMDLSKVTESAYSAIGDTVNAVRKVKMATPPGLNSWVAYRKAEEVRKAYTAIRKIKADVEDS